jgi:hypothetical protein
MTPKISRHGFRDIVQTTKSMLSKWTGNENAIADLSEPDGCIVVITRHDDWNLADVLKLAEAEGANQIYVHLPVNDVRMAVPPGLEILVAGAIVHEAVHVLQNMENRERFDIHASVQNSWRECMKKKFGDDYSKRPDLADIWLDSYYVGLELESHAAQFAAERKLNGDQVGIAEQRVRDRLGSQYAQLENCPRFSALFRGYMSAW